jgi:hypothetical protein
LTNLVIRRYKPHRRDPLRVIVGSILGYAFNFEGLGEAVRIGKENWKERQKAIQAEDAPYVRLVMAAAFANRLSEYERRRREREVLRAWREENDRDTPV